MPTEREFLEEEKARKEAESRPIPIAASVTRVAESVGTRLGKGALRSIAGNERHHPAVRAMAARACEVPTPDVPTVPPHRFQGRAPKVGDARPLFAAERQRLAPLLARSPYDLTDAEVDLVARLAATTDPAKAPRDAAEETRADHDLVGTIYRPLTERFDHEYAVAGAEARAAAGLAAAPVLPITPALAEAAAADFKARNPDVSDAYAIEEGRRELAAARDQVLRQRRQQHREAVDRLEETRQAADEHRRRAKKAAMASVT